MSSGRAPYRPLALRPEPSAIRRFASDVQYYLQLDPRQLPSRYLYDDLGSALFEAICRLPWYPITRAELRLLETHGSAILQAAGTISAIVELGSGSGDKLATLMKAARRSASGPPPRWHVHLVDLSPAALATSSEKLASAIEAPVTLHQAAYEEGLREAAAAFADLGRVLVLFLGSNIGNFDPPASEAFIRAVRRELRAGDGLLLGADLVKPPPVLALAYDDPLGVSAAFNRNLLVRVNRELRANFNLTEFAHRAVWNRDASRIEMHLVAKSDQEIDVPEASLRFAMRAGETIWTESSYKYERESIAALLHASGFAVTQAWTDERDRFSLTLAEAV